MKKNIIFGTAGHIDHGKSSLIKALTGKDPDRLQEEKEKGITIELGYASLDSEDALISFVDVPGHERLIKTMVSGSVGFDAVLFCIDGREGIMPQTVEHFNILSAVGIKAAVAAVTKADICTPEQILDTSEQIKELFNGSRIRLEAVIPVSIHDIASINHLKDAVIKTAVSTQPKIQSRCYLMRVDRVFSIKGHGTVVTGTSLFGKISPDSMIYNINTGGKARIRSIQVHDKPAEKSIAGQRTALNVPDFSTEDVQRGHILSENQKLTSTTGIYAFITAFDDISKNEILKNNKSYPLIIGSEAFEGKIIIHGEKVLESGKSAVCFIKLDRKAVVYFDEPFILRSFSPLRSVAGGRVLALEETLPDRKISYKIAEHLSRHDYDSAFREMVDTYKCGLRIPEPIQFSNLLRNELTLKLAQMNIICSYGYLLDNRRIEKYIEQTLNSLSQNGSLQMNRLQHTCEELPEQLRLDITNRIIETAQKMGFIFDGHMLKLKQKDPFEDEAMLVLQAMKQDASLSNTALLSEKLGMKEDKTAKCMQYLCNRSFIRKIEGSNHVTMELINTFVEKAVSEAEKADGIDLNTMKDHFQLPRKLMVPLMEQLDKTGLFTNKNNKRYLRK